MDLKDEDKAVEAEGKAQKAHELVAALGMAGGSGQEAVRLSTLASEAQAIADDLRMKANEAKIKVAAAEVQKAAIEKASAITVK